MFLDTFNWVTMIEIPLLAALFRIIFRQKRDCENSIGFCRDALAEFKLHVARNYVSVNYLKDVENRLTDHLLRIEKKLDGVEFLVKARAGAGGKLFGSVTSKEIAEAVSAKIGVGIDKKKLVLDQDIKSYGSYEAVVKLYAGISAKIRVKVAEE